VKKKCDGGKSTFFIVMAWGRYVVWGLKKYRKVLKLFLIFKNQKKKVKICDGVKLHFSLYGGGGEFAFLAGLLLQKRPSWGKR